MMMTMMMMMMMICYSYDGTIAHIWITW